MIQDNDAASLLRGSIPDTIDNDWHRFYHEFPEIYDRFAITTPLIVAAAHDLFDFTDKVVIDAGSGTGKSSFALAGYAQWVYGIEPSAAMRAEAERTQRALGASNITFIDAAAPGLPLVDRSADALVSVYAFPWHFPFLGEEGQALGERYLGEARRVLRPGSTIIAIDNAPGWYGGEIVARLRQERDDHGPQRDAYLLQLGFASRDIEIEADFGSVAEAIATYGFIYGRQVIAELIAHDIRSIRWRPRLYWRLV